MKLCEINPFIRGSSTNHTFLYHELVCAKDHRLFYLQEGIACLTVKNSTYTISPGTIMLWKSGTDYCFESKDQLHLIVVNFDYTQAHSDIVDPIPLIHAKDFSKEMILEEIYFDDAKLFNTPLVLANMKRFEAPLQQIVSDYKSKMIFFSEYTSSIFKQILVELVRCTLTKNARSSTVISSIIQYIHNNYASEIDNKVIANQFNYHEYHINKLMVKYTGVTLHQYLINYRLFIAKQLVINTDLSFAEIAEKTGFESAAYFSNCFKKDTNSTPSDYRNIYQYTL